MGARSVQELVVWQLGDELRRRVYELSAAPRVKADVRFCNQIRDAASSVPRNIAEGYGRFRHREFAQFVFISRGSAHELRDLLRDGSARGYWSDAAIEELYPLCDHAIAALTRLGLYLRSHPDR